MAISLAQTAGDYGGTVLNYCKVTGLIKENELVCGVLAEDQETGDNFSIRSKVIINATGVFADKIIQMDEPGKKDLITPSQGIHIVLDKSFLPNEHAIMVPQTADGRVMFAVPWHDHVIVGTTDTLVERETIEPVALDSEIEFILHTAGQYLVKRPTRKDILSIFAGLRPLAKPEDEKKPTKEISRGHKILISVSGLVTIIGGKWTTYRKMAEDTIDKAAMLGGLHERECVTKHLPVHGFRMDTDPSDPLAVYGIDREDVLALEEEDKSMNDLISEKLLILKSQVVWSVRKEWARTVEDVLARRTRALFLDARESIRIAPMVAEIMASELGKDDEWKNNQIKAFEEIAKNYFFNE
jgi:glycerol-3-phosphate dehydrogenase